MPCLSHFNRPELWFGHNIDRCGEAQSFSLHCHDCFELYLFLSGEGYYVIEGNRYELRPLSLLAIRPGEVHCFRQTGLSDYERYVVNFTPAVFEAAHNRPASLLAPFLEREMGKRNLYLLTEDSLIYRLFMELDEIGRRQADTGGFESSQLLGVLLAKLGQTSPAPSGCAGESGASCQLINRVIPYINRNLTRPLCLDEIAAHFYVSKYHLSRTFKKLIGVSVIDYVIRKRVFLAEQILKAGSTTAQACAGAGFGDYTSFFRSFKRVTGYSPVQMKGREESDDLVAARVSI